MNDEDRRTASDVQMETLERLEALVELVAPIPDQMATMAEQIASMADEVRLQNERIALVESKIDKLETWQSEHQPWSESGRDLIQELVDANAEIQEKLTRTMLATQTTNRDFERTIVRVLDDRQPVQASQFSSNFRSEMLRFKEVECEAKDRDRGRTLREWTTTRKGVMRLAGIGAGVLAITNASETVTFAGRVLAALAAMGATQ